MQIKCKKFILSNDGSEQRGNFWVEPPEKGKLGQVSVGFVELIGTLRQRLKHDMFVQLQQCSISGPLAMLLVHGSITRARACVI